MSRRTLLALGASLGALPRVAGSVLRTPPGGALRWPLLAPWRVSDPARAVDLADAMMTGLVHDTLATLGPDGTVLYPLLAAPPTLSADGLRATLTLRPEMRFANGAPFTAQAVAASWQAARGGALGRLVLAFGQSMAPFAVRGPNVLELSLAQAGTLDAWLVAPPLAPTAPAAQGLRAGLGAFAVTRWGEGPTLGRNPRCPRGVAHLASVALMAPQARNEEVRAFTAGALDASWWGRSLYGVERQAVRVEPAATGAVVGLVLPPRGVVTSAPLARTLERCLAPLSAPNDAGAALRRLAFGPGASEAEPASALVRALAARGPSPVLRVALDPRDALLNDVGERAVALLDGQGVRATLVPHGAEHDAALRAVAPIGADTALAFASFVAASGDEAGASAIVRSARARRAEMASAVWGRAAAAVLGVISPGAYTVEALRGARVDAFGRLDLADAWMARGAAG